MKTGFVKSHFLDSGAFSLSRTIPKHHQEKFFDSKEFWNYIDKYASFIKKYKLAIDYYANLDVIGNPELTWRNQKYLEQKHSLKPVPVIHYQTDVKWLRRYMEEGYKMIGLGGLVGNTRNEQCKNFLNDCFNIVCDNKQRLPKVKIHGFGLMEASLLSKYPFWSVDATNAEKLARYGKIFVPRKTKGSYDYKREYMIVALSERVKTHKFNIHSKSFHPKRRAHVKEWLDYINNSKFFNRRLAFETNAEYKAANYFYYMELLKHILEWPRPFNVKKRERIILYISGGDIEKELADVGVPIINLMLSFYTSKNKPEKRFLRIYHNRKRIQKKK